MTFAFIEFEDVMARPDRTPIVLGVNLVRAMRPVWRLGLSTRDTRPELVKAWLMENGFSNDTFTYQFHRSAIEATADDDEMFDLHLDAMQANAPVELVVTASPARAARAMQRAITVLMFGSPATARPEFRPGKSMKSWQDIEEEVSKRRILRTKATVGTDADEP